MGVISTVTPASGKRKWYFTIFIKSLGWHVKGPVAFTGDNPRPGWYSLPGGSSVFLPPLSVGATVEPT